MLARYDVRIEMYWDWLRPLRLDKTRKMETNQSFIHNANAYRSIVLVFANDDELEVNDAV